MYQFWGFNALKSLLPKTANSQQIWSFWSLVVTPRATNNTTLKLFSVQIGKNVDICGCLYWAETTGLQAKTPLEMHSLETFEKLFLIGKRRKSFLWLYLSSLLYGSPPNFGWKPPYVLSYRTETQEITSSSQTQMFYWYETKNIQLKRLGLNFIEVFHLESLRAPLDC